jgi:hypothetical protein
MAQSGPKSIENGAKKKKWPGNGFFSKSIKWPIQSRKKMLKPPSKNGQKAK